MQQKIPGACRWIGLLVLILMALIGPAKASASGIFFQFNSPFPGDPNADGGPSWLDAYFVNVTPGEVQLSITNLATGNDFIAGEGNGAAAGGISFNLISSLDVSNLNFTVVSGASYNPSVSLSEAQDGNGNGNNGGYGFKSDGDGFYDIAIEFGNNFGSGASITFDITNATGLTAADFESLSTDGGGEGDFYAAAHIMGISGAGGSTWVDPSLGGQTITVPEPASSAIAVIGSSLFCAARLWRRGPARKRFSFRLSAPSARRRG